MSENTEYPSGATGDPDHVRGPGQETGGYDASEDPDADPEMLNPRHGDRASGTPTEDPDPDSDPDSLNPRGDA